MARKTTRRPGSAGPRGRTNAASSRDTGASQAEAKPDATPETDAPETPPHLSEADAQPGGDRPADTRPAALPEEARGGSEAEAKPDAAAPSGTDTAGASEAEAKPDAAPAGTSAETSGAPEPKAAASATSDTKQAGTDDDAPGAAATVSGTTVPKSGRKTGTTPAGASQDRSQPEAAASGAAAGSPSSEGAAPHRPTPATAAVDQGTTARPSTTTKSDTGPDSGRPRGDATGGAATGTATGTTTGARPATPAPATTSTDGAGSGGAVAAGLLGGVLGGALALGIGWLWLDRAGGETEARLAAIEAELEALPPAADLTPLTEDVARLRDETEGGIADLGARVDALSEEAGTRIAALETRLDEGGDGTLAEQAVARWQRELDELRANLQAQADEIAAMAETAAGEIADAEKTAAQLEAEAAAVAARARARAVLATVEAALETGEPYADTLEELQAASPAPVPEPLVTHAADGVASRAELVESFPEGARAALALARREGLSGETGGRALGFLRDTFQLRSTAPSEGGDVNAVLSRAEAALREGRLDAALAEIETLPEPVQAEIADWTATARDRAAALAAAEDLSQSLSEN